ncbi:N-acetyltransferase [Flaviaesturariibacter flavus]|uniref:N-acetyltransferase n=1 Tax=Flaviaesturariibacter flavus TaxID=2502780 RepID=A0A4R1BB60_9BACT|nr:acyltransferase [Flaviaesturariibacter flavus]TCJ14168.1 N-acetyltransferase [Flaviaesturariibacter flavus]
MNTFIHPTAIVEAGAVLGEGVRVWHFCHLMPGCELGPGCNIGQNVFIAAGVRLGRNVKVQNNVSLYEGVQCADDVFIGPSAVFTNIRNPRSAVSRKDQYQPTLVGRGATIGANATVVCGNPIGAYAFIGAGSVVTHPVPDHALVLGNPARLAGWVSELGHRLQFNAAGQATCPESGAVYVLSNNQVSRL